MAAYLYKTKIYHDTSDVVDPPVGNDADVTDFEGATKKPNALKISSIVVSSTTFLVSKSYTDFDTLIDGSTILWSDVKFVEDGNAYSIYLASNTQL